MVIFLIFLLFCFGIFYYTSGRIGTERNDNFYFLSFPVFSSLRWLKLKQQWYFLIFWIFLSLFRIFYHASGKNGTGGYFLFSLFRNPFLPIFAWNGATMVFFNFFHFLAICLEFSVTRRIGTKRNYNSYFLSFSSFSNQFWLEMNPQWYFLIF